MDKYTGAIQFCLIGISLWIGIQNTCDVFYKGRDINGWRIIAALVGLPGTIIGIIGLIVVLLFICILLCVEKISNFFSGIKLFGCINEKLSKPIECSRNWKANNGK